MRAAYVLAVAWLVLPLSSAWAAAAGEECDGKTGTQCDAGLWCEHAAGQCDVADAGGMCMKETGPFCTEEYNPVCGCDGKTYPNDCHRKSAKAQLNHVGECE